MNKNSSGCGMLLVGVFVLGAIMWGIAILLWVLAFAVPAVALFVGGYMFVQARTSADESTQARAVEAEIEALARDTSLDLAETITRWDSLILTKGIGTPLEGQEQEAAEIHRRLLAAHETLHAAITPAHRIEAVLHAETLRATAQSFL
ncbi:hypothetical protein EAH68_11110 [Corynebacterium hylobatis]|uniref:Uncharacterized protein n=1 Tax=Corynebacterium hylobatis TaxID=1859290 RepID=A0A430HW52_9CORY|nr:hypothetical protein [Corynebacterium hylobatis]RSZ61813.1 hypothetical protein EAH68_11110 [Corynebacterium hylobatis]